MKSKIVCFLTICMILVSNSMAFANDNMAKNDEETILSNGVLQVNFAEGETEKRVDLGDGRYAIVGYTVEQDANNGLSRSLGDTGTVTAYANITDREWNIVSHSLKATVKYEYGWDSFRVYSKSAWVESLKPQIQILDDTSFVECNSMIVSACKATAHFTYKVYNTEYARMYDYIDRTFSIDLSIKDGVVTANAIRWDIY